MGKFRIYGYRAQSCYIDVEAPNSDIAVRFAKRLGSDIAVHLDGPVKCANFGAKIQALKDDEDVDFVAGAK